MNDPLCPDQLATCIDPHFLLRQQYQQKQRTSSLSESRSDQSSCETESTFDSADTESDA